MDMDMNLADAQRAIDAGLAEASKMDIRVGIVVVDAGGYLLAAARMDGALLVAPDVAQGKAVAAALFQRPSGEMAQMWPPGAPVPAAMNVRTGGRFIPHQGAVPVRHDGKVIGAIGVSGAKAAQDEEVATAAAHAIST